MKSNLDWILDVPFHNDKTTGNDPCPLILRQTNINDYFVVFMLRTEWKIDEYPCPVTMIQYRLS